MTEITPPSPQPEVKIGDRFVDSNGNRIRVVDVLPNSFIAKVIRPNGSEFPNLTVIPREWIEGFDKLENVSGKTKDNNDE